MSLPELSAELAHEIAREVVASRKMQRDNGLVYGAALEAATIALSRTGQLVASTDALVERDALAEAIAEIIRDCEDELAKLPCASPFACSLRAIAKKVEALTITKEPNQ